MARDRGGVVGDEVDYRLLEDDTDSNDASGAVMMASPGGSGGEGSDTDPDMVGTAAAMSDVRRPSSTLSSTSLGPTITDDSWTFATVDQVVQNILTVAGFVGLVESPSTRAVWVGGGGRG